MNSKNTGDGDKNAESVGVRENANEIRVLTKSYATSFPPEWKIHCRSIIERYRTTRQKALGYKRFGWTYVRDEIMVAADVKNDDGSLERDPRLTRQDLEAWQRGTDISDEKFKFIDVFVRRLEADEEYAHFFDDVRVSRDMSQMLALANLYVPKKGNEEFAAVFRERFPQCAISDEIENAWFSHIVIKVVHEYSGVFKCVFCYLPAQIEAFGAQDFSSTVFYDGFIIPLFNDAYDDPVIKQARTRCVVKLVRPEFQGNYVQGYADGEIYLSDTIFEGKNVTSVEADYPNTILHPALSASDRHHRYSPTRIETKASLARAEQLGGELTEEEIELDRADFLRQYQWKIEFVEAEEHNELLEKLISNHYKGYIF